MDKEWLETAVKRQARDKKVARVISVDYEPIPRENYCSVALRARMRVVLGSGRETTKSVLIKKIVDTDKQSNLLEEWSSFKVETKVYNDVLYHMDCLMDEYQDERDRLWGELVAFVPYDTIVFQDLNEVNFKCVPKNLDLTHSLLVVKSIGQFHALSRVLLENGLISDRDLKTSSTLCETFGRNFVKDGNAQMPPIGPSWPSEWKEMAVGLSNGVDESRARLQGLSEIGEDTFLVLNHGDCRTTNFMFKYSRLDEAIPAAMKFTDYQMAFFNSFGWDLTYFIYGSVNSEDIKNNYELLLDVYLDSLTSTLDFYGYTSPIPSLEDVKNEVERLDYLAFIAFICVHPQTDTDRLGLDRSEAESTKTFNSEDFYKEMNTEIKRFIENK